FDACTLELVSLTHSSAELWIIQYAIHIAPALLGTRCPAARLRHCLRRVVESHARGEPIMAAYGLRRRRNGRRFSPLRRPTCIPSSVGTRSRPTRASFPRGVTMTVRNA